MKKFIAVAICVFICETAHAAAVSVGARSAPVPVARGATVTARPSTSTPAAKTPATSTARVVTYAPTSTFPWWMFWRPAQLVPRGGDDNRKKH